MAREYRIPPLPSSRTLSTAASDRTDEQSINLHYSPQSRGSPEPDSSSPPSDQSDGPANVSPSIDILYVEIVSKVEIFVKRSAIIPALKQREEIKLLQTTLADLRVWAYDLADGSGSILEYFRSISNRDHELKSILQHILDDTDQLALLNQTTTETDLEIDTSSDNFREKCRRINKSVERLKAIKPRIAEDMLRWRKSCKIRGLHPSKPSPPAVLTFDGGGTRSYASLLILKTLMEYINEELAAKYNDSHQISAKKPCDLFDFMFGSSSGGLIAIMLGRLEMTVEECIEKFCAYSDTVFGRPKTITQATRRIVGLFDPVPENEKWKRNVFGIHHSRCKTGVLAADVSSNAMPYMFRTYDCGTSSDAVSSQHTPLNRGPASGYQIWEVARATSAAPLFFSPMLLDDKLFVDGGLVANNPTQEALREVAFLHGGLLGSCVVSIGSGTSSKPVLSNRDFNLKRPGTQRIKDIIRNFREAVTQTGTTDMDVQLEASLLPRFEYFRFNTINERLIRLDEWQASGGTRIEIESLTKEYLEKDEVKMQMRRCASVIAARTVGVSPLHSKNMHYIVPRAPNSFFVGRTDLLRYVRECLVSNHNSQADLPRIFVITGMGGQGKSEFCLKLAHYMREEFWGVFWVDVSTPSATEYDFSVIARTLGFTYEHLDDARWILGAVKEKWLLILDNADDPEIDYRRYFPYGSLGTIIINSRMKACELYQTIGTAFVDSLSTPESVELLLRISGGQNVVSTSSHQQAKSLIDILGAHTLAIIQAGAYIAAGHCRLDQYAELLKQHREQMLRYTPLLSKSRYGNIHATFEASAMTLGKTLNGKVGLSLLKVLSTIHHSSFPLQIFEDAWNALHRLDESQPESIDSQSIDLLQRHIAQLCLILDAPEDFGTAESDERIPFRLSEAIHVLDSLALINRNDHGISMHPLTHTWVKQRQSKSEQAESWMTTGSIIALSSKGTSTWHLFQSKLRPHLQSFLDVEISEAITYGPPRQILDILLQCGHILLQMHDYHKLVDLLVGALRELEADPSSPTLLLSRFYELSARNAGHLGKYEEAERLSRRIVAARNEILGSNHLDTLIGLESLAVALRNQGKYGEAEQLSRKIVATREEILAVNHPDTLAGLDNLTIVLQSQGKYEEAEQISLRVVAAREKILGNDHPMTLTGLNNLAVTLQGRGRYDEAEHLFRQVVAGREKVLGMSHPDTLTVLDDLAIALQHQGKYEEAQKLHLQVLQSYEKVFGALHPSTIMVNSGFASMLRQRGQLEEAVNLLEHSIEVQLSLSVESPHLLMMQNELGRTYLAKGEVMKAITTLEYVVEMQETLAYNSPSHIASQHALAEAYQTNGQIERAIKLLENIVQVHRQRLQERHPDILAAQCSLATAYQASGRVEDAVKLLEHVVQIQEQRLQEWHPDRLAVQHSLATAYQASGRVEDAVKLLEHIVPIQEQILQERHPNRLAVQRSLATAYQASGRVEDAVKLLEHVVQIQEQILDEWHPSRLASQHALAEAYEANGQSNDAIRLLEHVVQVRQRLEEWHPDRLMSQKLLNRLYEEANGQMDNAAKLTK